MGRVNLKINSNNNYCYLLVSAGLLLFEAQLVMSEVLSQFSAAITSITRKLKRFLSKSKGCRVVKSTTGPQCKLTRNKHGIW